MIKISTQKTVSRKTSMERGSLSSVSIVEFEQLTACWVCWVSLKILNKQYTRFKYKMHCLKITLVSIHSRLHKYWLENDFLRFKFGYWITTYLLLQDTVTMLKEINSSLNQTRFATLNKWLIKMKHWVCL